MTKHDSTAQKLMEQGTLTWLALGATVANRTALI